MEGAMDQARTAGTEEGQVAQVAPVVQVEVEVTLEVLVSMEVMA
jgi:hypothetical protein